MKEQNEDSDPWWEEFFGGPYGELQIATDEEAPSAAEAEVLASHLALAPGSKVLDVPCGTGRLALELARRGHRVTGVDFNRRVIEEGRRRARTAGLDVDLRVGDMRTAPLPEEAHAAYCWSGSFGYFDDAGNAAFLAHVASALRSGGRFALDAHATETIYPRFGARDWHWIGSGDDRQRVLQEREYDVATGVLRAAWTFQDRRGERQATSIMRLYSYRELVALLDAAGFVDVEAYDGMTDRPFAVGSSRLTVVATRR